MNHYKAAAWALAALSAVLLIACSGSGTDNQQFSCSGNITPFLTNEKKADTAANQQIEVHIHRQKISFAGNNLLTGKDVAICPPGNSGWADGGHYFDSEACATKPRKDGLRVYGTYNDQSGSLDLTNELAGSQYELVQGSFSCSRAAAKG